MGQADASDRVACVVVTYHPDEQIAQRLAILAAQVDQLIVVDNASSEVSRARLKPFMQAHAHRQLIINDSNLGIARALNQGISAADQAGAAWVLTMDQDTLAKPDLVKQLQAQVKEHQKRSGGKPLAVMAANFTDSTGKAFTQGSEYQPPYHIARTAITSGSLVNVRAWRDVEGYREDFFIDSVDHDFCFRVRQKGYEVLQSHLPLMDHCLGDTQKRAWLLGICPAIANYSATRRYYMTRNRVAMFKAHGLREPVWTVKELAMIAADALLIMLYEKDRPGKLRAMARGLWHGVRGRLGPMG